MGTTVVEAGGLQPAGGDEVPLQMTAEYNGDSNGDLQRFATIGNGRGGGGRRRLLRGCILFLTTVAHGGKCWRVAVHRGRAGGSGDGGGGRSFSLLLLILLWLNCLPSFCRDLL